uniref:Endoribonuclease n=1 Tax=Panagrolaimus sp. PS1159 TaxID=55785 RepID=A0AC35G3T1_9BILA
MTGNPAIASEFNNFDAELNFVENSFKTYYTAEHVEKITNGRFRASLFVGETLTGLFALPSFISTTGSEVPKLLGPKVIDRVETQLPSSGEIMENKPLVSRQQLSSNIPIKMTTYKTVGGEYLLLGYHIYPRSVLKDVLFNDPSVFSFSTPHRFLYDPLESRVTVSQPSRRRLSGNRQPALPGNPSLPRIQYKPEEDEETLLELLLVIWNTYPLTSMATSSALVAMTVATIYMCGRQSAFNLSTSQQSREASHASQRSRAYSTEASSKPWSGIFSKGSKASTFIEDENDPSLPFGWRQIGKIQYDPNSVLGQGCEGTIVYKGKFDGREAAVKRVITEAVTFVDREIDLLRESDSHQNVIRYFCSEADHNFRFIALELCECTLLDYVMKQEIQRELADVPKVDILRQATEGLLHLHNNNIIHRDIKPHNILLTKSSKGLVKAMISDFGLCKKLKLEHTSMSKVSGIVGTEGWQAAELYHHEHRITYAVDVFSMGCVYFYVLTNGKHPYGDKFHRQNNILMGEYNLQELASVDTSFNIAALNLIESMIQLKATVRPRLQVVLSHPMFWNNERQLQFFMDVSDRIEKEDETNDVVQRLERYGPRVSRNWQNEICSFLKEDLRKFRSYRTSSIRDLLRALRNKKHHYRELPPLVKESLGDIPNGYAEYWTKRFPRLLMHIYNAMICCAEESAFVTYYPMEAHSFCNRRLEEELDNDFIIAGPGGFLKHTTSTPTLQMSPRSIRHSSASVDNWRQVNNSTNSTTPSPPTPISHAPISANAAKKRKKKKKAPLTVLAPMEESDNEQQHENGPGGDNNDDAGDDREMSPS